MFGIKVFKIGLTDKLLIVHPVALLFIVPEEAPFSCESSHHLQKTFVLYGNALKFKGIQIEYSLFYSPVL